MTDQWVSASRIFDGYKLYVDHALLVQHGLVVDLVPLNSLPAQTSTQHYHGTITPGFFDVQVNGGGGVLLNQDPNVDGVRMIAQAHRRLGTVALLPTVITDRPEVIEEAASACLKARSIDGVMGIHIEGPHLSVARRGTHEAEFVRQMDHQTMDVIRRLRSEELPVLLTVAPESVSNEQISTLSAMGVRVSIGHSDASARVALDAVNAGVCCFTHLFNAMSPMLNRSPGVTGAGIASEAWCSIIADGIHVDPLMILLAHRARPVADRMIAISDAMPTVGGPDAFELYGRRVQLQDGRLVNSEGSLAGAHVTMVESIRNLVSYGVDLEQALRMGRHNPAQMMELWDGLKLENLSVDDLILLTDDLELAPMSLSLTAA